jgi:hypothetical protein
MEMVLSIWFVSKCYKQGQSSFGIDKGSAGTAVTRGFERGKLKHIHC